MAAIDLQEVAQTIQAEYFRQQSLHIVCSLPISGKERAELHDRLMKLFKESLKSVTIK